MKTFANKIQKNDRHSVAHSVAQTKPDFKLVDNRTERFTTEKKAVTSLEQKQTKQTDIVGNKPLQRQAVHQLGCGCSACSGVAVIRKPIQPTATIQRYCGVPGCKDPNCHDTNNHGISNFRALRNVDVYNAERDKSDLGKGSGTSKTTRDYVQDPNSFWPEEVSLSYTNQDNTNSGGSSYIQPERTPGMKPDAGHIFGNQYGGSGKDTGNIFAQEPKHNRGNSYKGQRTFEKWRRTENNIRKGITKGDKMSVTAKLHRKKRKRYHNLTISDQEYRAFMNYYYYSRRDDRDKGGGGGGITT
jgi:hypothetical protein